MKQYDTDDELERALWELPLEQPPADLRTSILAATIYRPAPVSSAWDLWAAAVLCALLTWLLLLVARGGQGAAVSNISLYVHDALKAFAAPATLFWICVGGGVALWISQLNLTVGTGAARASRR